MERELLRAEIRAVAQNLYERGYLHKAFWGSLIRETHDGTQVPTLRSDLAILLRLSATNPPARKLGRPGVAGHFAREQEARLVAEGANEQFEGIPELFQEPENQVGEFDEILAEIARHYTHRAYPGLRFTKDTLDIEPTTSQDRVKELTLAFLQELRVPERIGSSIIVRFRFTQMQMYRTQLVTIEDNTMQTLLANIGEKMERWMFDQQPYESGDIWEVGQIEVLIAENAAGALGNVPKLPFGGKALTMNKIYCPISAEDNCVLECFEYVKLDPGRLGLDRIYKKLQRVDYNSIRARLRLSKGMISIDVATIKNLSSHYRIDASVFEWKENKFALLFGTENGYTKRAYLCAVDAHCYLIKDPRTCDMEKCRACGRMQHEIAKHKETCKFCFKCRCAYNPNEDHSTKCSESIRNKSVIERKIKQCEPETVFTALRSVLAADFETFASNGKSHVPYAVGVDIVREGEIIGTNEFSGEQTLNQFMQWLDNWKDKTTLVFFNGSGFDLIFIYRWLVENRPDSKVTVMRSSGKIKSMKWKTLAGGEFTSFDPCLHIQSSLKQAVKDYECTTQKGDFDHKLIKTWDDVERHRESWSEYLRADVRSLTELYMSYARTCFEMFSINVNSQKTLTASAMAFQIHRQLMKADVHLPKYKEDQVFRQAIYGGRCLPFKRKFKSKGPDDYLVDLDVVSLYPTAMYENYFPTGKFQHIIDTAKLERFRTLMLGRKMEQLFIARISGNIPQDLTLSPLPRHESNLGWSNLKPIEKEMYTSVDLYRALALGFEITEVHEVYLFEGKDRMFKDYIEKLYCLKARSRKGTAQYATSKILLNGLYGKFAQRPVIETTELVSDYKRFKEIQRASTITDIDIESDTRMYVTYEIPENRRDFCVSKPCFVGAFILSYSREIMDRVLIKMNSYRDPAAMPWYTDTDSMIVHRKYAALLQDCMKQPYSVEGLSEEEANKTICEKELGRLDYDIKGKIVEAYFVGPKVYCCYFIQANGEADLHVRAKGIPQSWVEENWLPDKEKPMERKGALESRVTLEAFSNMLEHHYQPKCTVESKLARVFKPNTKQRQAGIEFSSIIQIPFSRILNKTEYTKRKIIPDEYYTTVPHEYCGAD